MVECTAKVKEKSSLNWKTTVKESLDKMLQFILCWSAYQRWMRVRTWELVLKKLTGSPRPAFERTWQQVTTSTPLLETLSFASQSWCYRDGQTTSPSRQREETERGECTDGQRRRNALVYKPCGVINAAFWIEGTSTTPFNGRWPLCS